MDKCPKCGGEILYKACGTCGYMEPKPEYKDMPVIPTRDGFYNGFSFFASFDEAEADLQARYGSESHIILGEWTCPDCGAALQSQGWGSGVMHRWVHVCNTPACGFKHDPMDSDTMARKLYAPTDRIDRSDDVAGEVF